MQGVASKASLTSMLESVGWAASEVAKLVEALEECAREAGAKELDRSVLLRFNPIGLKQTFEEMDHGNDGSLSLLELEDALRFTGMAKVSVRGV